MVNLKWKDLDAAKKILVMKIHKNRRSGELYLSQKKHTEKVLGHFRKQNAKLVSTLLAGHFK